MSAADTSLTPPDRFRGEFLRADDAGWDDARLIYNRRAMGRPAAIARCLGVADVRLALALARERGLRVAVRGGGHSVGGWSSGGDDVLVIDLTLMRGVRVDPEARTAWIGGGAKAGDVLVEAEPHGLVVAAGAGQGIGVTGLAMGLGEGYLTPKHGFGVDSLLAFELVTADGELLRVSAGEHPELFWAMRGAGHNFGVVTAVQLRLHPLPQQAVGGAITFHGGLDGLTRHVWEAMQHGSEHFWPQVIYTATAPGEPVVRVLPGHTGPPEQAERELGALCAAGDAVVDERTRTSYVGLVWELPDAPGRRAWEVARFPFGEDPARQQAVLLERVREGDPQLALQPGRLILLWRTPELPVPEAPGCAPRLPGITLCVMAAWEDPARDAAELAWVERTAAALRDSGAVAEAGNTVNHVGTVDQARARRLYGDEAYERLARLKAQLDPENVFRSNYNIPPAA